MAAFFGNRGRLDVAQAEPVLPELPTSLPYDMRDEMNWIDFSLPINPLGTPKSVEQAIHSALVDGEIAYRPDRDGYAFRRVLASFNEIPFDAILCGITPFQLIQSAALVQKISTVGVYVPSRIDYQVALSNAGHSIVTLSNPYSFATCDARTARRLYGDFEAALLANPSYPASRLLTEDILRGYLDTCSWVIVDESYIELSLGGESFIPLTQKYKNLIVVRNPSATYAMPGTPMAYLVAHPQTIERVKRRFDYSSVPMFPEVFSTVFTKEINYLEKTHEFLEQEIPWLQCMLSLVPGIKIYPAEGNFVLCSFKTGEKMHLGVSDAKELSIRLQLNGYLVPQLTRMVGLEDDTYLCVAAQRRDENQALISAMKNIVAKHV